MVDEFWDEQYCGKHRTDGTPSCTACYRLRAQPEAACSDRMVKLEDGRHMCLNCLDTMLPDTQAALDLYHVVRQLCRLLQTVWLTADGLLPTALQMLTLVCCCLAVLHKLTCMCVRCN